MAGIYIHIPFCRQACRYCDFFFSVSLKYLDEYIDALLLEIEARNEYLNKEKVRTLYFGGGTPSVLEYRHFERIFSVLGKYYSLGDIQEVTLEANPDDLSEEYLALLKDVGFNRLSIGIQSFREEDLLLMRRSHTANQAIKSLEAAGKAGFNNINADLIYALPELSLPIWKKNLETMVALNISHISAYHLTYEPGTVFSHWKKKGRIFEAGEELSLAQFEALRNIAIGAGFEHYEISNFAKPGYRSAHNQLYWSGHSYIGFGPSAHSYDGRERRWNHSSLNKYITGLKDKLIYYESEVPDQKERYHDYLITRLRTVEGAAKKELLQIGGEETLAYFKDKAKPFLAKGEMEFTGSHYRMSPEGWIKSDHILEKLFLPA